MKKNFAKCMAVMCFVCMMFLLTACGGKKPQDLLVGTWVSEQNDMVEFQKDGSCMAPFTYNSSWLESAERYTVKDDGMLLLISPTGHADRSYDQAKSEEDALENGGYFVSKKTLILGGDKYTKTR